MKFALRMLDIAASTVGMVVSFPLILPALVAVWAQDGHSPFYIANRVGRKGTPFRMVKIRSMIIGSDKSEVDSTAGDDPRITRVGLFIRRFKLDEIPQLWNVLTGDMSLVGPRPNVARDVALYTEEERRLLTVRPGITDLASIVFADEGAILEGSEDPDLDYNQRIRPYKSRLALLAVEHSSVRLTVKTLIVTMISIVSRARALEEIARLLEQWQVDPLLIRVARRTSPLTPCPPPGSTSIVQSRVQPNAATEGS